MTTKTTEKTTENQALMSFDASSAKLSISKSAAKTIDNLVNLEDQELVGFLASVHASEPAFFVLRGAAADEIVKRLEAANKKDDELAEEFKLGTALIDVAKQVGVSKETIIEDYKMYNEFPLKDILEGNPDLLLGREYYRLAMQVSSTTWCSPTDMLEHFEDQINTGNYYNTTHAKRDVKLVNSGKTVTEVKKMDESARKQALSSGDGKPKSKTMAVQVDATKQMQFIVEQIIASEHKTVSNWIKTRGTEEFGNAPSNYVVPGSSRNKKAAKKSHKKKAAKKTPAKKKAAPKTKAAAKK